MTIFSGEPLPIAPKVDNPELDSFHRKILDYLRRIGAKLGSSEFPTGGASGGAALDLLSLILDGDQSTSSSWANVTWGTEIRRDTQCFQWSSDTVTVLKEGLYLILLNFKYIFDLTDEFQAKITESTLGDLGYSFASETGGSQCNLFVPVNLGPNDSFVVKVQDDGPRDLHEDGTRLFIARFPVIEGSTDYLRSDDPLNPFWEFVPP